MRGLAHEERAVEQAAPAIDARADRRQLEELISRAVAQWAWRTHWRNPITLPVIIEE